ncbi:hypothetical protein [Mesorhizobium delmotii]|uniref:Glycosyltransferase RgtA/B/C/D-like domain-containing protein n=1 Tax=Mesorhizobium delmotii TaxID=1631247 RepID=A0A2P9AWM6_9HYPH|nr:hypothetical protein [Mesorhizobium delmotii]SJM35555.1 conserved membrane hypothetical protein [Mesorhizobium delmotii]
MNGIQATVATVATASSLNDAQRARVMFCLLVAPLVAFALSAHTQVILQDPDCWWQVKVGLDLLANRTFPVVDSYSHTFAGHPWIAKEWLGQVLLALAYTAGGWNGVAVLIISTIALTGALLSWYLSTWLRPMAAVGLALFAAAMISPIYTARPHIFTLPIIVIWTAMLFRAARNEQGPPLWLLALLVLWANLHATFTIGFVIAAFAGLDVLVRTRLSNPVLLGKWVAFGLLCPVVSLINPYGMKAILATFTVAYGNEAVPLIIEWKPFDASDQRFQEVGILLFVFALLVSKLRIGWAKAMFIVFALHIYLTHLRFMYLFFLLVPIVLAAEIAEQYPALSLTKWMSDRRDGLERFFAERFYRICGVAGVLLLGATAMLTSAYPVAPSQKTSAKDALAFVESHHLSGNVLNSYNFGGSLIFHGIKTFIDGRTDQLFLNGFMKTDAETGRSGGKPVLEAQLEKHAIDWALLTPDDSRIPFFDELGWKRAYADDYAVIYTRDR